MNTLRPEQGEEPGHDSGHAYTWGTYLAALIQEYGTLAAVAMKLTTSKVGGGDALTIERGLRRLRTRGHKDGGDYGRALLRMFGIPKAALDTTRWMGLYHSRFGDLPVSFCEEQLRLWDKSPVADSVARAFVQLGLASQALRRGELEIATSHVTQAKPFARTLDAQIELALVGAYISSRRGEVDAAEKMLSSMQPLLGQDGLSDHARICFAARWLDQRAYLRRRDLLAAKALYLAIEESVPFAASRRAMGLAYVAWKQGHRAEAEALAHDACTHAGDGGFVRLRVMALSLLGRITDDAAFLRRAERIALGINDDALVLRVRAP